MKKQRFIDLQENDIIYCGNENCFEALKIYKKYIKYGYIVLQYDDNSYCKLYIPMNHCFANRLKCGKHMVMLSKRSFRKYCLNNMEKVLNTK